MISISAEKGIEIAPALVAGEPVTVRVAGIEFGQDAKPILIVTSRFPDRIVATSEILTDETTPTVGAWTLAVELTAEKRAALAQDGFADVDEIDVRDGALYFGDNSYCAVREEDGKAFYLGGDHIIGFAVGDLVATYAETQGEGTDIYSGTIDLATIEIGQMFCHARADEKLAASVELVDAHNRKSLAQATAPIRNSALLLARLHGIKAYTEAVDRLREAFGVLDNARPLTAGETALRVQQIVNALQSI